MTTKSTPLTTPGDNQAGSGGQTPPTDGAKGSTPSPPPGGKTQPEIPTFDTMDSEKKAQAE